MNRHPISAAVSAALLLLALASACDRPAASSPAGAPAPALERQTGQAAVGPADTVVAYYFHGNRRCATCLGIQETIEQTVLERFGAETGAGRLVFHEINIDQEENRHYVEQFQLSFSTLIVAAKNGTATVKWENCDKVWEHAHNHPALKEYTAGRIRAYLDSLGKG